MAFLMLVSERFAFLLNITNFKHIVRWDPNQEDSNIFACSSDLYVCYRIVQIQIHRPLMARTAVSSSSIVCATSARYDRFTLSHLNNGQYFIFFRQILCKCASLANAKKYAVDCNLAGEYI
jgi:hypothetical protein